MIKKVKTRSHTPGPWEVFEENDTTPIKIMGRHDVDVNSDTGREIHDWPKICTIADTADQWDNAHLIAAAPELLEALKDVIARIDFAGGPDGQHAIEKARVAIAKVRGQ